MTQKNIKFAALVRKTDYLLERKITVTVQKVRFWIVCPYYVLFFTFVRQSSFIASLIQQISQTFFSVILSHYTTV